jgi:hypothetical protein
MPFKNAPISVMVKIPMMIPSIVSAERKGFALTAVKAIDNPSRVSVISLIVFQLVASLVRAEQTVESVPLFCHFIAFDFSVSDADDAICMVRNIFFMGYENNGIALLVKFGKESHDVFSGFRIKISCRFIGK